MSQCFLESYLRSRGNVKVENKIRSNIVDQKLKTVPADLSRLSHVLDNDVVTSGLFTKTV